MDERKRMTASIRPKIERAARVVTAYLDKRWSEGVETLLMRGMFSVMDEDNMDILGPMMAAAAVCPKEFLPTKEQFKWIIDNYDVWVDYLHNNDLDDPDLKDPDGYPSNS
ncbi:MAG: hypothetical protein ACYSW8_32955 [Planctomycetota bacterium]|jgi:hypothetical protein